MTNSLPAKTAERIEREAKEKYPDRYTTINVGESNRVAHIEAATAEALKAQVLVKELESIRDGYDHDEDAHRYNNNACRCCNAETALKQYNQTV